jgi:RimJ/RimL family protein N-acetyltransferase
MDAMSHRASEDGYSGTATDGGESPEFSVAPLRGRHVVLRQIVREDYRYLRAAELSGELGVRWRFRGSSVSPEQWAQNLWQGILAQFIVQRAADAAPVGLVMAYRPNFQDGHAWLAAESFAAKPRSPLMVFGVALFVDYVFKSWDLHKLYLEVAAYNLPQFESGVGRLLEVEGRLRDHYWYDGHRWDQVLLALYRSRWLDERERFLAAEREQADLVARVRLPAREVSR